MALDECGILQLTAVKRGIRTRSHARATAVPIESRMLRSAAKEQPHTRHLRMSGEEPQAPIGETLDKRFLVRRVIGSGGMGAVYEVEHVVTKRLGALKLLHAGLAGRSQAVERFVREASAAGRIGNPHIVETFDAGELASGEPYMFMELLSGRSIRELLLERERLSLAEARDLVRQAAEGLAAAHAAGIVHRDIKPENLFLCDGPGARLKILDFGISKFEIASDHRLTAEGVPMGTPYYMSPEQVAGKSDVDTRSDVYSLGVVLYECVTGKVPFDAATLPALSIKIFEGHYAKPSDTLDDAPAGLDQVIARAMAVEPSRRYASMDEFRDALLRLPGGSAVTLPGARETSDLARETADPAREAPGISVPPPQVAKGARRPVVLAGALVSVLVLGVVLLARPFNPPEADADAGLTKFERAVSLSAPVPAPPEVTPTLVSPTAPPAPPTVSSSSAGPPSARPPRAAATALTPAARDGLTEENPFAE
jgi:hypothetical protein